MIRKIILSMWIIIVSVISILIGFMSAAIIISPRTPNLLFLIFFTLLVVYGTAYGILRLTARRQFEKPGRTIRLLAGLPVIFWVFYYVLVNLINLARPSVPTDANLIAALESSTIPLSSVDSMELDSLSHVLEGHQIVAVGEATHGTSEFFRMKHSVIAYLITDLGFRNYGMEISPGDGIVLNQYIHGEDVDLTTVLYWPWATEEVADMLDWMRHYNEEVDPANQVTLFGIDPRMGARDQVMAENVTKIVEEHGPIVVWAHNSHIWAKEEAMGSYLRRTYGTDAYLIGFEFLHGRFTSRTGSIHTFEVNDTPPTYYAHALGELNSPIVFLDMATLQKNPILEKWLNTSQLTHNIAEAYHLARLLPGTRASTGALPDLYDGLIFIEESSPAVVLPGVD